MGEWPSLTSGAPPRRVIVEDRAVRKDIRSAKWDGGGDLTAGKDTTATDGYLLDYSASALQAQAIYAEGGSLGDLTVDGDLIIDGGSIFTSPTDPRIQLYSAGSNVIRFFTGDVAEVDPGFIQVITSGSGTSRTVQVGISAPTMEANTEQAFLVVRSESPNGSSFAPGVVVGSSQKGSGSGQTPEFRVEGMNTVFGTGMTVGDFQGYINMGGSRIYFDADTDTNSYIESYEAGNRFDFTLDDTVRLRVNTAGHLVLNGSRLYMGSLTGDDYMAFTGTWRWFDDNVEVMAVSNAQFSAQNIYDSTSGSAANVFVDSAGRLFRSTA